jgi:hypothetical protein
MDDDLHRKPRCFSDEDWAAWNVARTAQHGRPNTIDWACIDCTPLFKRQMMSARRCDWPCVEFFKMEDGTIEGRRTSIEGHRGYTEGRKVITLKVQST